MTENEVNDEMHMTFPRSLIIAEDEDTITIRIPHTKDFLRAYILEMTNTDPDTMVRVSLEGEE